MSTQEMAAQLAKQYILLQEVMLEFKGKKEAYDAAGKKDHFIYCRGVENDKMAAMEKVNAERIEAGITNELFQEALSDAVTARTLEMLS